LVTLAELLKLGDEDLARALDYHWFAHGGVKDNRSWKLSAHGRTAAGRFAVGKVCRSRSNPCGFD
jgi:hypothetical protein